MTNYEENREDGGPAFPLLHSIDGNWTREPVAEYSGMTMRDWFAGMALHGYLTRHADVNARTSYIEDAANAAFKIADAMIAERMK